MTSQTDGAPWSPAHATRHGGTSVPFTRPEKVRAIPLAELEAAFKDWTADVARARAALPHRPQRRRQTRARPRTHRLQRQDRRQPEGAAVPGEEEGRR